LAGGQNVQASACYKFPLRYDEKPKTLCKTGKSIFSRLAGITAAGHRITFLSKRYFKRPPFNAGYASQ